MRKASCSRSFPELAEHSTAFGPLELSHEQAIGSDRNWRHSARSVSPRRHESHGLALLAVMCCLVAVSVLVSSWLKSTAFERQQIRLSEQQLQSDWLAEAALNRAFTQLAKSDRYSGETWALSAKELGGPDGATIEIQVAPVPDHLELRRIQATADFPADETRRRRAIKELVVDLASLKKKRSDQE